VVAHLYHLAQYILRYEIVKNRLRNTQKLYFLPENCKFSLAAGGFAPQTSIASGGGGLHPQTSMASSGRERGPGSPC